MDESPSGSPCRSGRVVVSAVLGVLCTDIPGRLVGPLGGLANDSSLPLPPAVAAVL
ncbi:hypothetical protein [Streptomyces griseoluteus]|uniref:hypothetical protein n=1 Tax=Streptomyces griseoluteus TaxID=29306 RepID=UPI00365ECEA3